MFDKRETAVLRGFDMAVTDLGDQLHIRHPLLAFEGEPNMLYVARRLNWKNDKRALAVADPSEASELATLFPHAQRQPIASGEGVIVAGAGFVQATATAEIQLSGCEMSFERVHEPEFWISTATQNVFADLQTRLVDEARAAFDDELGSAARHKRHLSERGDAALLLLRRCGPLRREDLAIRQLAGAGQNRELDLYRRLLIRFEFELEATQDELHGKVKRHIELAAQLRHTTERLLLEPEKLLFRLHNPRVCPFKVQHGIKFMGVPSRATGQDNALKEKRLETKKSIANKQSSKEYSPQRSGPKEFFRSYKSIGREPDDHRAAA